MSVVPGTDNVRTSALPLNRRGTQSLSFSSLNSFGGYGGCELQWAHRHVYKTPERPMGAPVFAGRCFDESAKAGWDAKIETGADPTPDLLADAFTDTARTEFEATEYDMPQSDVAGIIDRGTKAAKLYAGEVVPLITPLETQRWVSVHFDEVAWELTGKIDLVAVASGQKDMVSIIDTKATMGSAKYDPDNDFQLGLYTLGAENAGRRVAEVGFHVARMLKTKQEVLTPTSVMTDAKRETTMSVLDLLAGRIEDACATGDFLPTAYMSRSWRCSAKYCPFWDSCQFGAKARTSVAIPNGVAA